MKAIKQIVMLLVFLTFFFSGYSTTEYTSRLFTAYLKSDMVLWKTIIDEMDSNELNQKNIEFTAELVSYQYGYVAWMLGNDFEDEAENYLDVAEENLTWLEVNKYDASMTNCYRAAFYGFRIALNHLAFAFYGMKTSGSAEKARQINPENPFAYVQLANVKYYQPEFMGGSKAEAIKFYLEAETKFLATKAEGLKQNWLYLNALAMIAISYSDLGEFEKAKLYFKKMLVIQPNYGWIKYEMLPDLLKKMEG